MKENIFSRKDAKTAKVFLGELGAFARVIIEICLICKDVGHSRIASGCGKMTPYPPYELAHTHTNKPLLMGKQQNDYFTP